LLGCSEVSGNKRLIEVLWDNQSKGGYESALSELQQYAVEHPDEGGNNLADLEGAIEKMFNDMNNGYFGGLDFEFQTAREMLVKTFLAKFDEIYTLNQDVLIERHYIDNNVALISNNRWNGSQLPGMRRVQNRNAMDPNSWAQCTWTPTDPLIETIDNNLQPYYKLHGSSNWRTQEGGSLLIMGGDKARKIGLVPILNWYHRLFENSLKQADVRLMIIGYSFGDSHINKIISDAVKSHKLEFFVIDPRGSDIGALDMSSFVTRMGIRSDVEQAFSSGLIGASRRLLSDIFGKDVIEHNKIMRFLNE
jgi:hypothetical protein